KNTACVPVQTPEPPTVGRAGNGARGSARHRRVAGSNAAPSGSDLAPPRPLRLPPPQTISSLPVQTTPSPSRPATGAAGSGFHFDPSEPRPSTSTTTATTTTSTNPATIRRHVL